MRNRTLFSCSFPKFSLASGWDFFGKNTARVLHPQLCLAQLELLEPRGAQLQPLWTVWLCCSGGSYRRMANGGSQGGLHLKKSLAFLRSITEQMWNNSTPGLGKTKQKKWVCGLLELTEFLLALEGRHRSCTRHGSARLHPFTAPHLLPPDCWQCSCSHSQDMCPASSTKNQSFPSTRPLAIPCTVIWNTEFELLLTKLKTQSKVSLRWWCVFLPQELAGQLKKTKMHFPYRKADPYTKLQPSTLLQHCSAALTGRQESRRPVNF